MRNPKKDLSKAKQRLLGVAESLVAERGFDAVSIRDVTKGAEANVAAVNYHFGSREEMLDLLVLRTLTPVNEERMARLEIVENKWHGKAAPAEELLDAAFRPLLGRGRKLDLPDTRFRKLCGRILALEPNQLPPTVREQMNVLSDRLIKAIKRSLPEATREELGWRFEFATGAMIRLLLVAGADDSEAPGGSVEAAFGRLIRFAASGLRDGEEIPTDPEAEKGPQSTFDF